MTTVITVHGIHTDQGFKTALVKPGSRNLRLVFMTDRGLVVVTRPLTYGRQLRPLTYRGQDYPLKRACRIFQRHAKSHGTSKAARALLKEAKDNANSQFNLA